jgi:hypothetical protein
MTNESPDRLDLILDAAIRDYSNTTPRAGIDQQILRHVQTTPRRPAFRLAWALVMAAIVLSATIALRIRDASPPVLALLPPPPPQVSDLPVPARNSMRQPLRRRKHPGPAPLTPEERALLRLVRQYPEQALAALSPPAGSGPLEIEPLKIEQLQ